MLCEAAWKLRVCPLYLYLFSFPCFPLSLLNNNLLSFTSCASSDQSDSGRDSVYISIIASCPTECRVSYEPYEYKAFILQVDVSFRISEFRWGLANSSPIPSNNLHCTLAFSYTLDSTKGLFGLTGEVGPVFLSVGRSE